MLIYNATKEVQSVKALGNWFTFKPKQIKMLQDDLGQFLAEERADHGLVAIPEKFEDAAYLASEEGKKELGEYEQRGIDAYVRSLRQVIYNNQVSLRQDLEMANLKVDPSSMATDGELRAMQLVAKYQKDEEDKDQKRADEVRELMKKVGTVK